jgi:hypothetical protein
LAGVDQGAALGKDAGGAAADEAGDPAAPTAERTQVASEGLKARMRTLWCAAADRGYVASRTVCEGAKDGDGSERVNVLRRCCKRRNPPIICGVLSCAGALAVNPLRGIFAELG